MMVNISNTQKLNDIFIDVKNGGKQMAIESPCEWHKPQREGRGGGDGAPNSA